MDGSEDEEKREEGDKTWTRGGVSPPTRRWTPPLPSPVVCPLWMKGVITGISSSDLLRYATSSGGVAVGGVSPRAGHTRIYSV